MLNDQEVVKSSQTIAELKDGLERKYTHSKFAQTLIQHWAEDSSEDLASCLSEIKKIEADISRYKSEILAVRSNLAQAKTLFDVIDHLSKHIEHTKENLPKHLPCNQVKTIQSEPKQPSQPQKKENNAVHKTSSAVVSVNTKIVVQKKASKPIPKIPYVSIPEYNDVPSYLKGRIVIDKVNEAIDYVNLTVEKKYELMRTMRSKLTPIELDMVHKFKMQVNSETKSCHFFIEEDIKKFSSMKLDTVGRKILNILRTLKRLKEVRGPGQLVRLVIVTSHK